MVNLHWEMTWDLKISVTTAIGALWTQAEGSPLLVWNNPERNVGVGEALEDPKVAI